MAGKWVQFNGSVETGNALLDVKFDFLGKILPSGNAPRLRFRSEWSLFQGYRREDGETDASNRFLRFSANLLNE